MIDRLRTEARDAARRALAEDLAGFGDLAGRPFSGAGRAHVEARQAGVLSGVVVFEELVREADGELGCSFAFQDGQAFAPGATIATLQGRVSSILALERAGLNFLGRLSGIATLTAKFVAETAGTGARIAATRKTTPGLRLLEKQAVVHGGGEAHRFGLSDGAMIKDNHIAAAGGVSEAIAAVRAQLPHGHGLEVEVDTLAQLEEALAAGVPVVLLDNMTLDQVRTAAQLAAGRAVVEVSGGVRREDVRPLAEAGADVISVGALTTRAPWIDFSIEVE